MSKEKELNEEKDYSRCCDYCLSELSDTTFHCDNRSGRFFGCHEFFAGELLLREHRHPTTGGCRWPGNLEDFYRVENIWYKKESKPEESENSTGNLSLPHQSRGNTPDHSRNSKRTQGVAKRSTSKDSDVQTYRVDRPLGPY